MTVSISDVIFVTVAVDRNFLEKKVAFGRPFAKNMRTLRKESRENDSHLPDLDGEGPANPSQLDPKD